VPRLRTRPEAAKVTGPGTVAGHPHLSIGEVLSLLQEEFPDVTISKIRFLESQGLVDPERTPSGYRKFYDADIDRLRWVLRQQRDAFLPLKVIKGRLEEQVPPPSVPTTGRGLVDVEPAHDGGAGGLGPTGRPDVAPGSGKPSVDVGPDAGALHDALQVRGSPEVRPDRPARPVRAAAADRGALGASPDRGDRTRPLADGSAPGQGHALSPDGSERGARSRRRSAPPFPLGAAPAARPSPPEGTGGTTAQLFDAGPPYSAYGSPENELGASRSARAGSGGPTTRELPAVRPSPSARGLLPAASPGGSSGTADRRGRPGVGSRPEPRGRPDARGDRSVGMGAVPDEDELALEELVSMAGVDAETVRDLERYGLISPRVVAGTSYYSQDAAEIARLASAFARHGVEARHLRAYKGAADREAGIVQQVIMPLIRQRNPEARLAASQAADELSDLGGDLRAALLRAALSDLR